MEEYISHEDYKKMLGSFGKQAPKKALNEMHTMEKEDGPREFHKLPADIEEDLENEGNAFTAGLAKTKKGGEFKVGNKKFKDRTNYDAPVNEYQFDQMYPDDPGPFAGKDVDGMIKEFLMKEDDVNWDRVDDEEAEENETDNGIEEDANEIIVEPTRNPKYKVGTELSSFSASWKVVEVYNNFTELKQEDPESAETAMMVRLHSRNNKKSEEELMSEPWYGMKGTSMMSRSGGIDYKPQSALDNMTIEGGEMEEDINLPSSQATGPSIEEGRRPLSHLSPEERDQLRQYVETIKTVKNEIKKMVGKQDMEEGGNMTNLIMRPNTGGIRK